MVKLASALLMVAGALLKAVCWSGGPYHMLTSIGRSLTEQEIPGPQISPWVGELGLPLFGLGILGLAISCHAPLLKSRILFSSASVCLVLTILAVGFSNWILGSAFSELARSPSPTAERLMQALGSSWLPSFIGWNLMLLAAVLALFGGLANSSLGFTSRPNCKRMLVVAVGALSAFILTLAAMWSASSVSRFDDLIVNDRVKPTLLAIRVTGAISATYLSLLGVAGCVATLFLIGSKEQAGIDECDIVETQPKSP